VTSDLGISDLGCLEVSKSDPGRYEVGEVTRFRAPRHLGTSGLGEGTFAGIESRVAIVRGPDIPRRGRR
jgi:hypothetical protein